MGNMFNIKICETKSKGQIHDINFQKTRPEEMICFLNLFWVFRTNQNTPSSFYFSGFFTSFHWIRFNSLVAFWYIFASRKNNLIHETNGLNQLLKNLLLTDSHWRTSSHVPADYYLRAHDLKGFLNCGHNIITAYCQALLCTMQMHHSA